MLDLKCSERLWLTSGTKNKRSPNVPVISTKEWNPPVLQKTQGHKLKEYILPCNKISRDYGLNKKQ